MRINGLTPTVKNWIGFSLDDTKNFWSYLNQTPEALHQAVDYAERFFNDNYPDLPFDEVCQENIRRVHFEFYIVRHRLEMSQISAYDPSYFNELAEKYGFMERMAIDQYKITVA